jgi:hypothetical protein
VRTSRRYQVRFPSPFGSDLEAFARQRGLGLCPAIRFLVGRGLAIETATAATPESPADSPAALAALMAAEHAVLMVASVLPEGQQRMRELGARAAAAAEERLAIFREAGP